jgi:signal transduction histidine kinase/CheY-like chemotaxis protein
LKLRTHLLILVLGAVLPVLAFSAVMGAVFWRQQRAAYDQRYLERVRALAMALDREIDGHIRALQVLAQSAALQQDDLRTFYDRLQRVRAEQTAWDALIVTDAKGQQVLNTRMPFGAALPKTAVGEALVSQVVTTGRPVITPLIRGAASGRYTTAVVIPVRFGGAVRYLLIGSIEPVLWLELLARYPIVSTATMTLVDQNGIIVARTLGHDRWVGKPPSAGLLLEIRRGPEAAYRNIGLEGQRFYSAHARVPISGWSLATGVPAEEVEAQLRGSAIAFTAGAALVAILAVGLALVFGRRVAQPVSALARAVTRFGEGDGDAALPATVRRPVVDELTDVARAFEEASARLRAREAALRESRAQAETANRLKDEFLAVLSHELRTPINAVYGWARLLRSTSGDARALQHGLEVIERNAAAQVKLIEDLLDISRIVSGKMRLDVRSVDVANAVESAVDSVRHAVEMKEIRLETVLDPRAGPVAGDPDRLRQVVWNLLSNAIKFTPKGGRVQVRLARVGSRVQIVVADSGAGITPDLLPYVFERFRQGDSTSTRQYGGLGLGLALVKHIAELHGGHVRADSAGEDKGATFTVELPVSLGALSTAPHPTAIGATASLPSVPLDGLRVLVVDDDRDTLDLFQRMLGAAGADVRTASSTPTAMALFREARPDVLVCDIEMPGEDGYALIQQVRALDLIVPAVAVTAYGRVEDRVRLLAAGYDMHLPKPVDPAELAVVVATLARHARDARA